MNLRLRKWEPKSEDADVLWGRLNEGWRDLVTAFASYLPFSVRDQTFQGPQASLSFSVPGTTRPRGVILMALYQIDTGSTTAVTFAWTYSDGMLTTTSFSGLSAVQWRATFLVIGGG